MTIPIIGKTLVVLVGLFDSTVFRNVVSCLQVDTA